MNEFKYTFTVFTPTYNRAHTLYRVYNSLEQQTMKDFEWIIIDDGSSDNTKDIVDEWRSRSDFPIKYHYTENGGKLRAFKIAIGMAEGELFLTIDSDDYCKPNALERFILHWTSIPSPVRHQFAGVCVLCENEKSELIGTKFPNDNLDSNFIDIYTKYKVKGDKWAFFRTDILKDMHIPEIAGEKRIASSLVWFQIGMSYKHRFVNEVLMTKEYQIDGITKRSIKVRTMNSRGSRYYYQEYLKFPVPFLYKLRGIINYIRFSFHAKIKIKQMLTESNYQFATSCLLPLGYFFYRRDLILLKKMERVKS